MKPNLLATTMVPGARMSTPGTRMCQIWRSRRRWWMTFHRWSPTVGKLSTYTAMLSLNHRRDCARSCVDQARLCPCSGLSQTSGFSRGEKGRSALGGAKPSCAAMSWKSAHDLWDFRFQWHMLLKPTQHQFRSCGSLSSTFFISHARLHISGTCHFLKTGTGKGAVTLQMSPVGCSRSTMGFRGSAVVVVVAEVAKAGLR
mmetsp:Transcript_115030/g.336432  ORF Transcript_115030/g.336432 Transcript_115030/m.336432 type:complete len:200 (-) Transcript_115030:527-1126(-)